MGLVVPVGLVVPLADPELVPVLVRVIVIVSVAERERLKLGDIVKRCVPVVLPVDRDDIVCSCDGDGSHDALPVLEAVGAVSKLNVSVAVQLTLCVALTLCAALGPTEPLRLCDVLWELLRLCAALGLRVALILGVSLGLCELLRLCDALELCVPLGLRGAVWLCVPEIDPLVLCVALGDPEIVGVRRELRVSVGVCDSERLVNWLDEDDREAVGLAVPLRLVNWLDVGERDAVELGLEGEIETLALDDAGLDGELLEDEVPVGEADSDSDSVLLAVPEMLSG